MRANKMRVSAAPLIALLAVGAAITVTPASGRSRQAGPASCNDPANAFDNVYCERKIFMQADADLNRAYRSLRTKLGAADRTTLLHAQRAWIRNRDAQCASQKGGTTSVDLACAKDMTITRTNWLTDRLRECTSSGCRSRLLR